MSFGKANSSIFGQLPATESELSKDELAIVRQRVELAGEVEEESLMHMLASYIEPIPWLFEDFIVDQDQVMIAGTAKAGKSWMALDLAIAAATGGKFLRWQATRRLKTLYVNLEVGKQMWGRRVVKQLGGAQAAYHLAMEEIPFFVKSDMRTLDVMDDVFRRDFAAYVKRKGFEFVVFDVLSRCHSMDENLNGEMKQVLLNLRLMAPGCASVVVHHARKPPPGQEHVNLGPSSVRGASSIIGEVDLAMILSVRAGQGARYSLTFAARNIEEPEEMLLDRSDDDMRYVEHEGQENNLDEIIQTLFKGGHSLPRKEVQQAVADGLGVAFETARKAVKGAVERGLIEESRQGRQYFYFVPKTSPVLRVVPGGYAAASNGDDCPF